MRYLFFWLSKNFIHSSTSDSMGSMKTIVSWFLFKSSELFVESLAAERSLDFWRLVISEFLVLLKRKVRYVRDGLPKVLFFRF